MQNEIFYYYLRDEGNHPYGCVAIQETGDGRINRGVSICSTMDKFDRKHARGLALVRLKQASQSLLGQPFGVYRGDKPLIPRHEIRFNKFDCNVEPTAFERRIIEAPTMGKA